MRIYILAFVLVLALAVSAGAQTTVYSEDFESYADNAALTAAMDENTITGLSTANAFSGTQSVYNPHADVSGARLTDSFTSITTASDANPVVFNCAFFDDVGSGVGATGSAALNGRCGLTAAGYGGGAWAGGTLENYFYIGAYHSVSNTKYIGIFRFPATTNTTPAGPDRTVGWHDLEMVFETSNITFFVDSQPIGQLTGYTAVPSGLSCFRLGSYAGQGYMSPYYDDVLVLEGGTAVDNWYAY